MNKLDSVETIIPYEYSRLVPVMDTMKIVLSRMACAQYVDVACKSDFHSLTRRDYQWLVFVYKLYYCVMLRMVSIFRPWCAL